jgi:hypothetical protein
VTLAGRLALGTAGLIAILVVWALFAAPTIGGETVVQAVTVLFFGALGATIVVRADGNAVGWLLLIPGVAVGTDLLLYSRIAEFPREPSFADYAALAFAEGGWLFYFLPFFFLSYVFPTGRLLSPRWRWSLVVAVFLLGAMLFGTIFATEFTNPLDGTTVPNPIGFVADDESGEGFVSILFIGLLVLFVLSGPLSLVLRYRRGDAVIRAQIKWVLLAGVGFASGFVLGTATGRWSEDADPSILSWAVDIMISSSAILLPLAITIAITRYRLFEIDRLVSRTVSYGVVIAGLAGVYAGALVLLRSVLPFESEIAVVASTLVVIGLFNPFRRRVQTIVDRRFFRSRYDAVEVVRAFTGRLTGPVDGARLADELAGVLDTTMRPETVGVWLRGGQ